MEFENIYRETLQAEALAFNLRRDVLRVQGIDSETFLQGQVSQDVTEIESGESKWSFILNPDGKVSAWLRITRLPEGGFLLDVDENAGEETLERLLRFKLRVRCEISLEKWHWLAIRGKGAEKYLDTVKADLISTNANWPLMEGVDVVSASIRIPEGPVEEINQKFDLLRILNGVPRMGRELNAITIPAETGLVEQSVSFDKGCYTGQELVARLDSRGNKVSKHLRILYSQDSLIQGDIIEVAGENMGQVTSSYAGIHGSVALAYVSRKIEPPTQGTVNDAQVHIKVLPW